MRRPAGFTLVELLVAISILAMVAVLGWRGLDGIVRARTALTEQMEATRGMQLAFAQMQSDCEHIADAALLGKRAFLLVGGDRVTLVRMVLTENEPSRVQVVAYRLREGQLLRRESNGTRDLVQLDVLWQAAISDTDTGAAVVLQTGVAGMQVETWENMQWRQAGAPAAAAPPPPGPVPALPAGPGGLKVALQVTGMEKPMSKAFLLGGI
jgi:general secretion pathway protein J